MVRDYLSSPPATSTTADRHYRVIELTNTQPYIAHKPVPSTGFWSHCQRTIQRAAQQAIPETVLTFAALFWGCVLVSHIVLTNAIFITFPWPWLTNQQAYLFFMLAIATVTGSYTGMLIWRIPALLAHLTLWSLLFGTLLTLPYALPLLGLCLAFLLLTLHAFIYVLVRDTFLFNYTLRP